jgi:hypothetical protein
MLRQPALPGGPRCDDLLSLRLVWSGDGRAEKLWHGYLVRIKKANAVFTAAAHVFLTSSCSTLLVRPLCQCRPSVYSFHRAQRAPWRFNARYRWLIDVPSQHM